MIVVYNGFPIYNTDGSVAGILDGQFEATPNEGQQPGWYALRRVQNDGTVGEEIEANVHIIGNLCT